jgi:hypothetical protein
MANQTSAQKPYQTSQSMSCSCFGLTLGSLVYRDDALRHK